MATEERTPHEAFGEHGEPCPGCRAPLADDQRYCLNCGRRRAGERVPYAELLAGREAVEVLPPEAAPPAGPTRRRPGSSLMGVLAALAGVVVFALGMVIGLLVKDDPQQVAAAPVVQKPPVVNVTTAGGGPVTDTEFVSDWPEGESGFTVQLETLPSTSVTSEVDLAKSDAEAQGALAVGALNSDEYTSLEPGNYVVYSGVFTGKGAEKKAKASLKDLKKDFPDAEVVKVSSGDEEFGVADEKPEEKVEEVSRSELEDLESATGEEQQKKSARLPDTLKLPGAPPPKDDAAPGGGEGGGTVIE